MFRRNRKEIEKKDDTTRLPKEVIKKIQSIHIHTNYLVNDILAGEYESAFRGRGMEFEEVREYQTGDDVRDIDWNVTARMGHPYVKIYREERELTLILMVDVSNSAAPFVSPAFFNQYKICPEILVVGFSPSSNLSIVSLSLLMLAFLE